MHWGNCGQFLEIISQLSFNVWTPHIKFHSPPLYMHFPQQTFLHNLIISLRTGLYLALPVSGPCHCVRMAYCYTDIKQRHQRRKSNYAFPL